MRPRSAQDRLKMVLRPFQEATAFEDVFLIDFGRLVCRLGGLLGRLEAAGSRLGLRLGSFLAPKMGPKTDARAAGKSGPSPLEASTCAKTAPRASKTPQERPKTTPRAQNDPQDDQKLTPNDPQDDTRPDKTRKRREEKRREEEKCGKETEPHTRGEEK